MCRARTAVLRVASYTEKGPTFAFGVKWIFDCESDRCYGEVCSDNSLGHGYGTVRASVLFFAGVSTRQTRSLMNILDLVGGKPIKTSDERAEQIGPAEGIPIFGLDALSSAAYGPGAALSLLIPLGLFG